MKSPIYIKAYGVIETEGKILMTEDQEGQPGWKFPGGHIEEGELITQGLSREIKEEVGIPIETKTIFHIEDYFNRKRPDEHNMSFFFIAQTEDKNILLNANEVKQARYFSREELQNMNPDLFYPPHRKALEVFLQQKIDTITLL